MKYQALIKANRAPVAYSWTISFGIAGCAVGVMAVGVMMAAWPQSVARREGATSSLTRVNESALVQETSGRLLAASTTNVERMRKFQHRVPSLTDWYVPHPKPAEVINALVPPLKNGPTVCVGRFWLPRTAGGWKNVDEGLMAQLQKKPRGPQHLALCAHWLRNKGRGSEAEPLMQQARDWFWDDQKDARVYCSFRSRRLQSLVLALDWIEWKTAKDFEKAFARVQTEVLKETLTGKGASERDFHNDGYWNATHPIESAYFLEQLLAMCVCKVQPSGAAHHWAQARLAHLGARLDQDENALYSTFELHNVLGLISRRGGGREYGQQQTAPGFGGYEQNFASGGMLQIEAVDTATGRTWKLRDRNLYLRTRQLGLATEVDHTVANTNDSPVAQGVLSVLARFYRDEPNVGGLYRWYLGARPPVAEFQEFQALAGRLPKASSPQNQPLTERIGSRWHYRENPAQPDRTLRFWIANRDLECFRVAPDERCLSLAVGKIGLIDAHANRTYVVGALANGVAITMRTPDGEPFVAKKDFWAMTSSNHPYWSGDRALHAQDVLENPLYMVGGDGPVLKGDRWQWSRDYTDQISHLPEHGLVDKVALAKMDFSFDPVKREIEIIDTIRADPSLYVGWHFSPTHLAKLHNDGFSIRDGKDSIRVRITSLTSTKLKVTRRSQWTLDGYTLPLDWHDRAGKPSRVAENIGYTPQAFQNEYRVRVLIQVNPT